MFASLFSSGAVHRAAVGERCTGAEFAYEHGLNVPLRPVVSPECQTTRPALQSAPERQE